MRSGSARIHDRLKFTWQNNFKNSIMIKKMCVKVEAVLIVLELVFFLFFYLVFVLL